MALACFLLDEHVPRALERGLRLREPAIQIVVIGGEPEAPSLSTPDPDLLHWIAEHGCILVTNNRATMPVHLADHLAAGHHVPGILVLSRRLSLGETIDELLLIWAAGYPEEFRDRILYLPITRRQ